MSRLLFPPFFLPAPFLFPAPSFTNRPTHFLFVVVTLGPLTSLPHFKTFLSLPVHLSRSPEPVGTSTLERSSSATQTQLEQIGNEQLSTTVRNENPFQSFGGWLGGGSSDRGQRTRALSSLRERLGNEQHHLDDEQMNDDGKERGFSIVAGSTAKEEVTRRDGERNGEPTAPRGAPPR